MASKTNMFTDAPIIKRTNISATKGDRNISLLCDVKGNPPVDKVFWTHEVNGILVRRFREYGRQLTLPYVITEDEGNYVCRVSNGLSNPAGEMWQYAKGTLSVEGMEIFIYKTLHTYTYRSTWLFVYLAALILVSVLWH